MAQTLRHVAQRIVSRIEDDLNNRRGLHLDNLDDDVRKGILATWRALILEELPPLDRAPAVRVPAGLWEYEPASAAIEAGGLRFEMSTAILRDLMDWALLELRGASLTVQRAYGDIPATILRVCKLAGGLMRNDEITEEQAARCRRRVQETGLGGQLDLEPAREICNQWEQTRRGLLSDAEFEEQRDEFERRGHSLAPPGRRG